MGFEQIKLQHDIRLNIIEYKNLSSYSFVQTNDVMWSEWLNRLQTPMNHHEKYQRGLVVYGDIKDVEQDGKLIQKYRNDENIINRNTLALDYDDIEDFKGLYSAICKHLEGFSWAFHTTYNHTTEKPRIRLMVPLNKPVSAEDYRKYTQVLAQKIGYKIDEGSYQPSRAMALPVRPDKDIPYIFKYNDAPAITIEYLDELSKNLENTQKDKSITINYSNNLKKRDSTYWRDLAFGVSEGGRNQALASISGYLLRRYVDVNLVYGLVIAWGKSCNPPMDDGEINKTFNSILKKHMDN
ncbi:mobile element-associated protein [Staphylococcus saprophyticus]|uniref:primase alpha helix C-terminal domain-containing protein n=1 Tax=Staphylococcus saprophyticus TaxID=29385 RepID=UPI000853DB72|nr:primase alpha helix C-terminal domain-containing protein [Staphylococcus saprophyticus]MDW4342530.1 primase alpha helix C-terminal domain-containing protein [Staphylococcus saprophyticus]MDW4386961.1 primase alpha helix C-terminal domain-containing protein [Staphylococcus saprophyticus]MDW4419059.1 primase alpha helix C-terminal domain-containing protein [Staphylococcus saprophyticus]MDW4473524.1 primase alpha helix C-terminal domain-containing protein [Staphylococcus saprophyticus]OEK45522